MKKITTLSIAAIMGAAGTATSLAAVPVNAAIEKIDYTAIVPGEKVEALPTYRADAPMHRIDGPSSSDKYIDKAPEGEKSILVQYGMGYGFHSSLGQWRQPSNGTISDYIIGADNKVYINNILSQDYSECYIEGVRDGNRISFTFPQIVRHYIDDNDEEANNYALVLVEKPIDDRGNTWYFPADNQTYTFLLQDDGTLEPEDPALMIGQCEWEPADEVYPAQWVWRAIGDIFERLAPIEDKVVEAPEGTKFELWNLMYGAQARAISAAIVGDKIYLKGTCSTKSVEDALVVGTISGDKAVFETNQYMGIAEDRNSLCYFVTGALEPNPYNSEYKSFVAKDNLAFNYNAEKKVLEGIDKAFLFSTNKETVLFFQVINNPVVAVPDYNAPQAPPMPPMNVKFWDEVSGIPNAYEIDFDFPAYDENYCLLDPRNLSYQLIINGEPFTLDKTYYPRLTKPITNIPYEMSENEIFSNGYQHALIFYDNIPFDTLGLRTCFTRGVNSYYSEIVPVEVREAVETINIDEVKTCEIFDLSGRRVQNPAPGIYLKKYTLTDGRSIVRKEVIK